MMRMKIGTVAQPVNHGSVAGAGAGREKEWEMRPGGMLVQKRDPDSDNLPPPPTIRVRVKYGSVYHEINISSQATFGELKKMLTGPTGLHHQDQKLLFKDKERNSNAFLDVSGVKDKSKMVLVEDPISQEKRYLEMRKNAKMEKAAKTISEISLEVDRLAGQVSALESVISKGGKVAEKTVVNLIEFLMNQLLKLDGINGEGDVKLQRKMQVKRVQKCVETLDMLKIKNSLPNSSSDDQANSPLPASNGNHIQKHQSPSPSPAKQQQHHQHRYSYDLISLPVHQEEPTGGHSFTNSPAKTPQQQQQPSRRSASGSVVITTQWETFDSAPAPLLDHFSTPTASSTNPRLNWDLL
ncbi:PREDICTED: BAG family molecular chaperone regulator 1-like [Ipomoea nil]|uniref:BAG family molecular chaperone regulator 1-like n=1 Tax=Ipomoea nil TaxID=35883 RepID=UPI000900D986|nr:PREDICTED: BAG family molecular chaperone regulator 1-like [Ipomoea nil]